MHQPPPPDLTQALAAHLVNETVWAHTGERSHGAVAAVVAGCDAVTAVRRTADRYALASRPSRWRPTPKSTPTVMSLRRWPPVMVGHFDAAVSLLRFTLAAAFDASDDAALDAAATAGLLRNLLDRLDPPTAPVDIVA